MHTAAKIESRAGVEFEIVVVKNSELKNGHEIVQYVSRQLYLNTNIVGRGCSQAPIVPLRVESGERAAGQNNRCIIRCLENFLKKCVLPAVRGGKPGDRRITHVIELHGGRLYVDLKFLVEISGHHLETALCGIYRSALGRLVTGRRRLGR